MALIGPVSVTKLLFISATVKFSTDRKVSSSLVANIGIRFISLASSKANWMVTMEEFDAVISVPPLRGKYRRGGKLVL